MTPVKPETLAPWLDGRSFEECGERFDEQGYLIFENVLDTDAIQRQRDAVQPLLAADVVGRNDFEGLKSNRIYAMLAKSPVFAELIMHPLALAFAERDHGYSVRLSACLAINLQPGESVQPWHFDDAHITIPRPRPSFGVSAFWALDDMTETNGATEILPGSHHWDVNEVNGSLVDQHFRQASDPNTNDDPGARDDALKVLMPAGSMMVAKGSLWHRGGANKSDKPRLIVTPQYIAGWARQLENMVLAVPPDKAAKLPPRVRELIGYSIHPPFMGYVDGMHPQRRLPTSSDTIPSEGN